MVLKTDQERIKALLKDTITLLCRNGLTFKTEFSIEALIGITLDQDDVVLVSINEIIRTELGAKLAAARSAEQEGSGPAPPGDDWENQSDDGSQQGSRPPTPSSSAKRRRKRRRSSGQGSKMGGETDGDEGSGGGSSAASVTGPEDSNSHSEPPVKRSQPGTTSRMKNSVKQEDEDDDSKDIVFIKEEVDSGDWSTATQGQDNFPPDLSGIPSTSTSLQHQENFDFLHSGSLVPMSSQQAGNSNMWSDMPQQSGQNMTSPSPSSKRTSAGMLNAVGPGDDSQQTFGRTIYSIASEQGSVNVKDAEIGQAKLYICNLCSRTLTTKRGFEAHMGQHLGIFRYKCSSCGKGFPSTTALRDHERSHTGEKLTCPICVKQFSSSMGLKHHMKSIHNINTSGIFRSKDSIYNQSQGQIDPNFSVCAPGLQDTAPGN